MSEKVTERSPLSKALVVQPRTLETMDLIGLAEEFIRRGYPAPGLNMGLGLGKKPVSVEICPKSLRRARSVTLRTAKGGFWFISPSVYQPNSRSERCSYLFSDGFSRLDFSHL